MRPRTTAVGVVVYSVRSTSSSIQLTVRSLPAWRARASGVPYSMTRPPRMMATSSAS